MVVIIVQSLQWFDITYIIRRKQIRWEMALKVRVAEKSSKGKIYILGRRVKT